MKAGHVLNSIRVVIDEGVLDILESGSTIHIAIVQIPTISQKVHFVL